MPFERSSSWPLAAMTAVGLLWSSPLAAQAVAPDSGFPVPPVIIDQPVAGGTLKVYESTFDELAAAIMPIRFRGRHRAKLGPITLCDSAWTATARDVAFEITPQDVRIAGRITASWCGVVFNALFETTADVRYVPLLAAFVIDVEATSIQPFFELGRHDIVLPVVIDVAPALTVSPFPVGSTEFMFETAAGPQALLLSPSHIVLTKRDGYIELRASATLG